jgi:hypothetical protein
MMYSPQHYELVAGQSYLFFAKITDRPGVFRQIRDSHTMKGDEGVTRTLDARPLAGLSIHDAHWFEISLQLTNGTPSNSLYAIQQFNGMSRAGAQDFFSSDDFPRSEVLKSLSPLIEHTNEAVALAALRCFRTEQRATDLLRPHIDTLMKGADNAPTVPRRVAAISALSGAHLSVVSNALVRWSDDVSEEVRSQALELTPDYPGGLTERILSKHASDPSPAARAAVARAIGRGKFYALLPTLEKFLAERGEPVERFSQESINGLRQNGISANTNGLVSSSAAYALLNFDVADVGGILRANLSNEYFKAALCAISPRKTPLACAMNLPTCWNGSSTRRIRAEDSIRIGNAGGVCRNISVRCQTGRSPTGRKTVICARWKMPARLAHPSRQEFTNFTG